MPSSTDMGPVRWEITAANMRHTPLIQNISCETVRLTPKHGKIHVAVTGNSTNKDMIRCVFLPVADGHQGDHGNCNYNDSQNPRGTMSIRN
jgi:hypothetical protein